MLRQFLARYRAANSGANRYALTLGIHSRIDATVDHIVPRSRGGDTTWTNVVAACLRCNLRKGNRLPEEVGMRLHREPVHPKFVFSTHMLRHPHAHSLLDSWRKYLVAVPTPS